MADSASESDASSIDGGPVVKIPSPEQMQKRIQSLQQENTVLRMELETFKLKCKNLQEENKELRRASVTIQARAEQEEEYISNTLLKKIQALKNEKETLARNYEQEEEFLTNDLSRKLMQLRQEKCELEETLEKEQEYQVNKLMRKIEKLEAETLSKQTTLEQLRREKVELENALEQEQEALVNRLWKRMDKLEAEKRMLQEKLDQPVSAPPSPRDIPMDGDMAGNLTSHIQYMRGEVTKLRNQLFTAQAEHQSKMAKYHQEEKARREENLKLQRRLQMEIERREQLCRHLSESESSLEMDDERHFNEMTKEQERQMSSSFSSSGGGSSLMMAGHHPHHRGSTDGGHSGAGTGGSGHTASAPIVVRPRTVSSPIPVQSPTGGMHFGSAAFSPPSPMRAGGSGAAMIHMSGHSLPGTSPPVFSHIPHTQRPKASPSPDKFSTDKFVKPSAPPPQSPSPSLSQQASPMSECSSPSAPASRQGGDSPMIDDRRASGGGN